ncbi:hypothetical protein CVT25_012672 [Psilocybe cyanescens]|uniref:F-box domain-containing protein n=1 Tax=Psilocybe cyanescens TaxID=93625 RepID=A0A409VN19_PSICY|nr:hypothetical protein CVT25_012672 [Psilocybe cyanescens]
MTDEVPQHVSQALFEVTQQEGQLDVVADAESLPTAHTSFIDLPNEIIAHILGEVQDDEDLYQIAFLSRRINHISLSVYLSRRNFGSGQNDRLVLYDYNSLDVLRALDAALFKSSLTRLQYPFDCNKPVDQLGRELRGLRGIIDDKLSSLQEITIVLKNATTTLPVPLLLAQNLPRNTGNPSPSFIQGEVLGDFFSLLDSIVACGCVTLKFAHSGPQTTAMYDINVAIAEQFGGTRAITKTWGFSTFLAQIPFFVSRCRPSRTVKKAENSLKTLYLHSPISFHPHLGRWGMNILNDSAINVLSISQQRSVHNNSWALILPCISVPTLTSLTLDSCSMRLPDLLRFLMRHTGLQRLNLGSSFALSDANARHRVLSSPRGPQLHLTHFSASLDLFIKNFDHAPFLFNPSSLKSLTVLLSIPHGMCFSLAMVDKPLKTYIWRLKSIKEVRLALSFVGVPSTWIAATHRVGEEDRNEGGVHTLITHMDVHIKVYNFSFSSVMRLRELLVRFPALQQLSISTLGEPNFLDAYQKRVFSELAQGCCPKLDSVCFV